MCLALALTLVWVLSRQSPEARLQRALEAPEVREELVARLMDELVALWDSHPDPALGHVLQHGIVRDADGIEIRGNRFGMREREYALPAPADTVRVVVLGDSYVFGSGTAAQDRMGVFLERELAARTTSDLAVEVLHLGIPSWNVLTECDFVRRQLDLLRPDLVVHFVVSNDLDDVAGVRGFGGLAQFAERHRERAGTLIQGRYARSVLGLGGDSALHYGLDHESVARYREAARAIGRLERELERRDGAYLLVLGWTRKNFGKLAAELDPAQVVALGRGFRGDSNHWVGPDDRHWNRRGMQRLGALLYGVIHERGLLPGLDLPPWPEAGREVHTIHAAGMDELATEPSTQALRTLDETLDVTALRRSEAIHIHGGLYPGGLVGPYAALALRNVPGGRLRLTGRCLPRTELDGRRVEVRANDVHVGAFELRAGRELDESWALPAELAGAAYLTVVLTAEDFVYDGPHLRRCVVFQLDRLETRS